MRNAKWYLAAFAVGLLAGAGIVYFTFLRPASATISELRRESERLSGQYRAELDGYSELLREAGDRVTELERSLGAAEDANRAAIERAIRAENTARSIQDLAGKIQESGGRASELNRSIRGEADAALSQLRGLRSFLEENYPGGGKGDPGAED